MIYAEATFSENGISLAEQGGFEKALLCLREALSQVSPGDRILAIVADMTRDDNTHELFPSAANIVLERSGNPLDVLIAQGTHEPMPEAEKLKKIGLDGTTAPNIAGTLFDHHWDDESRLYEIGKISSDECFALTNGLIAREVPLTVNSHLAPGVYDKILIFGATVPHEVVGFAAGAKYLFPGVAGPELTHLTHWIGALAGIENTIGRIDTPPRRLIERAAEFISAEIICFTSVVTRSSSNDLLTHAIFAGDFRESFRRAAAISEKVHIHYLPRRYRRVVALLDSHYNDLWVGGKASYKLGNIVEPGGELLIYAPHVSEVSTTHGEMITKYGYAPIEIVKRLVESAPELADNLCVAAHLSHVAFGSRVENGETLPRFDIRLCSQIPKDTCERLNLKYLSPEDFDPARFQNDPDSIVIPNAGKDLYLFKERT
ncbi:MAG: lactate racemase domain-containing protein [Pyrinomonadaceae bacterium]